MNVHAKFFHTILFKIQLELKKKFITILPENQIVHVIIK